MSPTAQNTVKVGLLFLVTLAIVGYAAVKLGTLRGVGDPIAVTVTLDDAAGVSAGALVKVAGVEVGQVDALELVEGRARLTLSIDRSADVREDAAVQVRARSLLGEKYVSIQPAHGSSAAPVADGGALQNTRRSLDIDDLINQLGPILAELDTEDLSRTLAAVADALEDDPERIGRMLDDAEQILDNTAAASVRLSPMIDEGQATLSSVRRAADVGSRTLDDLSSAAAQADTIATKVDTLADEAASLLVSTRSAVEKGDQILAVVADNTDEFEEIMENLSELDRWEVRRLLREEGILVRLRPHEVEPPP